MKIFVFGSSITSSYWNGAATYYRGIYRQISRMGHQVTFAEPDAYGRQQKQDQGDFSYVRSIVYRSESDLDSLLRSACDSDLVIKHSGVGVFDELLEERVLHCRSGMTRVAFWDVDAPATLARVEGNHEDPFWRHIPEYDLIFTYGGGPAVVNHYLRLGAAECVPIYNALDSDVHFPVLAEPEVACDLLFLGNRLPDREKRVEEFFFRAAELAPHLKFILGGEGWGNKAMPKNVRWVGHVHTHDHNKLNSSARMVLNINRESMAGVGFSPPTRVFEAAGAGACLITDAWKGIETFFAPDEEILLASNAEDVVRYLDDLPDERAHEIGLNMRHRAIKNHTYAMRAEQVITALNDWRAVAA